MSADWIGKQMRLLGMEVVPSDRMLIVKADLECRQGDKEPGRYKITAFNEMAEKLQRYPVGSIIDVVCYTRTRDVTTNGKSWTAEDKILTMISELRTNKPAQQAPSNYQQTAQGYHRQPQGYQQPAQQNYGYDNERMPF